MREGGGEVVRRALAVAASQPGSWSVLHLTIECQSEKGMRSLEAFGNGVAVWNNRRQFRLTLTELAHLMRRLDEGDFAGLEDRYGGREEPPRGPAVETADGETADVITCRIGLILNQVRKETLQFAKGEQSPVLGRLAAELLDFCERQGEAGLAPADLRDGLEKVSRGELAPEVLGVMLHRKPDRAGARSPRGLLLNVSGLQATSQAYDPMQGYTDPLELELRPAEVEALARSLAEGEAASLPGNLWARDYTDLAVRILNHRRSVQARQFGRLTPATHGQRQQDFESILSVLLALHERVVAEGRPIKVDRPSR